MLLFSAVLGLEDRADWRLAGSVVLVVLGIALCSFGEVTFSPSGFVLVLAASAAGGLRWVLSHAYLATAADSNDDGGDDATLRQPQPQQQQQQ